jgi:hypothetical protein
MIISNGKCFDEKKSTKIFLKLEYRKTCDRSETSEKHAKFEIRVNSDIEMTEF